MVLIAPFAAVLILVSSQTGFNHHLRYVLPIFPFAFIWISRVARAVQRKGQPIAWVLAAAVVWSVASSVWIYPHSLSYFNEVVDGPAGGQAHLGAGDPDSNLDWGQDLLYLERWLARHPEARPLGIAVKGDYDPAILAIEHVAVPRWRPEPGWYAVSASFLRDHTAMYNYFRQFQPVAMAGYSIYVYHVTVEEANRVRRDMGLPEVPGPKEADGPRGDKSIP